MNRQQLQSLESKLAKFRNPIKGIPFEVAIKGIYGVSVLKFDISNASNQALISKIHAAAENVCNIIRSNPIIRSRPNEVGNDIEPFVITELKSQNLVALKPKTSLGKKKSLGYPDIFIDSIDGQVYLEVKTYAQENESSALRSLYLSPSDDPKVFVDAYHLLIGFEIVNQKNQFWPRAFKLVDLYSLNSDIKIECNSNNERLYNHTLLAEYP